MQYPIPLIGCAGLYILSFVILNSLRAQPAGFNYEEAKVPDYELPSVLKLNNGTQVTTSSQWIEVRRSEILHTFEREMYGRRPGKPKSVLHVVESIDKSALGGKAIRKEVTIRLKDIGPGFDLNVLIYLPPDASGEVPAFLGYNFNGNHTIQSDPGITLSKAWMRRGNEGGNVDHRATEAARGQSSSRWPIETIVGRGYGLVTLYYGDVESDHAEGWKDGIRAHIDRDQEGVVLDLEDWSAKSAWAWGLSRVLDYLEKDDHVDAFKVSVMGHSRLGKTSLWAGAADQRFAIAISNNSGCGGAALSRRAFGETVARINDRFPHWFCRNFMKYDENEAELPMDQHMLIALMAPRPVYVASAEEDLWADPNGEFLSAKHASAAYGLFGMPGIAVEKQPSLNESVGDTIGYHIRTGKHDVTDYDWNQYIDFADRHLKQ
tara:strand:+ start:5548 stop:6849 length:1302 start_codon:yes stop_codon:yes gene_type:complete